MIVITPDRLEALATSRNDAARTHLLNGANPAPDDEKAVIDYLLMLAEENLKTARQIKAVAQEMLTRIQSCQTAPADGLNIETIYTRLDLKFRRSARLLMELLATPDHPRSDEDLAAAVCVRHASRQALRVYIHDLRTALKALNLVGVVQCQRRQGYFVQSADAKRILKQIG